MTRTPWRDVILVRVGVTQRRESRWDFWRRRAVVTHQDGREETNATTTEEHQDALSMLRDQEDALIWVPTTRDGERLTAQAIDFSGFRWREPR